MTDRSDPVALSRAMEEAAAATRAFGAETARTLSNVTGDYRRTASGGREFSRTLTGAFDDVAVKGKGLSDTLRKLVLDISSLALNNAMRSVFGSGGGAGSMLSSLFGSLVANADGNAIAGGRIQPFAKGGVVASPMLFPLQGGMGLAGEAGAEAIMPLQRGADGRLGVAASGGAAPIQITFNVTAPDAESFRRSETQIAAMLARAASRGQRNL